MNEQTTHSTSMLWFLAGGLVGAGASLLFAPQSGKDARARMARTFSGGAEQIRGVRDRAVARGEGAWDEAALRVEGAAAALAGTVGKSGKRDVPSV